MDNLNRIKPAGRRGIHIRTALPNRRKLRIPGGPGRQPNHRALTHSGQGVPRHIHIKPRPGRPKIRPHPAGIQRHRPGPARLRPGKPNRLPVLQRIRGQPPGRHVNTVGPQRQHGGRPRNLHLIHPHAACPDGRRRTGQEMPQRRRGGNRKPLYGSRPGAGTQPQHHILLISIHHQLIPAAVRRKPLAGIGTAGKPGLIQHQAQVALLFALVPGNLQIGSRANHGSGRPQQLPILIGKTPLHGIRAVPLLTAPKLPCPLAGNRIGMANHALMKMLRIIRRRRQAVHKILRPVKIPVARPPGPITPLIEAELFPSRESAGCRKRVGNHPTLANHGPRAEPGLLGHRHLDAHHIPLIHRRVRIGRMLPERHPVTPLIQRQAHRKIPELLIPPGAGLKLIGRQGKHALVIPSQHHQLMRRAGQKQHAVHLLVAQGGNVSRRPHGRQGGNHIPLNGQHAQQRRSHLHKKTIIGGINIGKKKGTLQSGGHPPHPVPPGNSPRLGNIHILQHGRPAMINIQIRTRGNPGRKLASIKGNPLHFP